MPKVQYCWRCKCDIPMLDESEWSHVLPSLRVGVRDFQRYQTEHNAPTVTAKDYILGQGALDRYFEMTGYRETNVNALWHHRASAFGPPCHACGKPLRTSRASFCAECGEPREGS